MSLKGSYMKFLALLFILLSFIACQDESDTSKKELWIYTSMYKDTIAQLNQELKVDFPDVKFNWYQAGSEDIASKVNTEVLAQDIQADVLISSDRFWYEELANNNQLHSYKPNGYDQIPKSLKHEKAYYTTVSIPVMVLAYNNQVVSDKEVPKTFKEMQGPKWKDRFTTGSPLASGTNFTTMAMLKYHYGWDYFKALKKNNVISEGGNSAVIRRLQNKERHVGWVLLENLLRVVDKDPRIKIVYPEDGVIIHSNIMAITKKDNDRALAQKFADWMLSPKGQQIMTDSFMYSPLKEIEPPKGAPEFEKILNKSFPWTQDFIQETTKSRIELKETYTQIMFQ